MAVVDLCIVLRPLPQRHSAALALDNRWLLAAIKNVACLHCLVIDAAIFPREKTHSCRR